MKKRQVIAHYIVGFRNKNNYNLLIINVPKYNMKVK